MTIYLVCTDQESGRCVAFDKDDHTHRVEGYSNEEAIAVFAARYIPGLQIVDVSGGPGSFAEPAAPPALKAAPPPDSGLSFTEMHSRVKADRSLWFRRDPWPLNISVGIVGSNLPHMTSRVVAKGKPEEHQTWIPLAQDIQAHDWELSSPPPPDTAEPTPEPPPEQSK